MEKIFDVIKLTAKTGLMFANCDGVYSDREKDFIEGFIAGIEQFGDVDEQLKADVRDTLNHQYELYPVIADGETREAEKNNYDIWARELGIKK